MGMSHYIHGDEHSEKEKVKENTWNDACEVMNNFLIRWFESRKGHRKARWKRKFYRMWKRIKADTH